MYSLADFSFIQNSTESLKDGRVGFRRVLGEKSSNFASETDGDFDGVVCWSFKEEDEDLERNNFMRERLVDEMGEKGGCGMTDDLIMKKMLSSEQKKKYHKEKNTNLVIPLKRLPKLTNDSR